MILESFALALTLIIIFALFTSFTIFILGDSPYVPTSKKAVKKILEEAELSPGDKIYDIGAGDGRLLHYAEKFHKAKATGFEIDPSVYALARLHQLVGWKGKIHRANSHHQDISDADAVFCYMMPKCLKKFQQKFQKECKPGTKIISYTFKVGDLKPKKVIEPSPGIKKIYIYEI